MMKNIRKITVILTILMMFQGCNYFNIGEPQGVCEEMGCNYSDAGQCGDVFDIYKTRYTNINDSYKNIMCNQCIKGTQ